MATPTIKQNENTTDLCNKLKKLPPEECKLLSKDEEQKLISEWRHDREELNRRLCMHNIRQVFSCAKKYVTKTNDFDNLVQEGLRGLVIAAHRFDIDRGIKFITYATPWILKYIRATFYEKGYKVSSKSCSLDAAVASYSSEGSKATFENFVENLADPSCCQFPSTEKQLSANEQSQICGELIGRLEADSSLSAIDKEVFKEVFCECEKPKHVAEKHNLRIADLNAIKRKVLEKFRGVLQAEYGCSSYRDLAFG